LVVSAGNNTHDGKTAVVSIPIHGEGTTPHTSSTPRLSEHWKTHFRNGAHGEPGFSLLSNGPHSASHKKRKLPCSYSLTVAACEQALLAVGQSSMSGSCHEHGQTSSQPASEKNQQASSSTSPSESTSSPSLSNDLVQKITQHVAQDIVKKEDLKLFVPKLLGIKNAPHSLGKIWRNQKYLTELRQFRTVLQEFLQTHAMPSCEFDPSVIFSDTDPSDSEATSESDSENEDESSESEVENEEQASNLASSADENTENETLLARKRRKNFLKCLKKEKKFLKTTGHAFERGTQNKQQCPAKRTQSPKARPQCPKRVRDKQAILDILTRLIAIKDDELSNLVARTTARNSTSRNPQNQSWNPQNQSSFKVNAVSTPPDIKKNYKVDAISTQLGETFLNHLPNEWLRQWRAQKTAYRAIEIYSVAVPSMRIPNTITWVPETHYHSDFYGTTLGPSQPLDSIMTGGSSILTGAFAAPEGLGTGPPPEGNFISSPSAVSSPSLSPSSSSSSFSDYEPSTSNDPSQTLISNEFLQPFNRMRLYIPTGYDDDALFLVTYFRTVGRKDKNSGKMVSQLEESVPLPMQLPTEYSPFKLPQPYARRVRVAGDTMAWIVD